MAANWKSIREIANSGKRVVNLNHIFKRDHTPTHSFTSPRSRRIAHTSAYDKNGDDQVGSSVVPDEVIEPQSDKYWAPNPQTGVFGPATEAAAGRERGSHSSPPNGPDESVLEEKAWFRPTSLEDLEKPHHH